MLFFSRWFFGVLSISGVFAVTFSVVFAYVADCTEENERSTAYGLVSTFACSTQIFHQIISCSPLSRVLDLA